MTSAVESLRGVELFRGLSEEQRRSLADLASAIGVTAGETILRPGDRADALYVIRRGRAELTFPLRVMGETREVRYQSLDAGHTLAWTALAPPHRLALKVRATTDLELLAIGREPLLALLGERPDIGLLVMSNLARFVAARFHELVGLWVRELQRNVSHDTR